VEGGERAPRGEPPISRIGFHELRHSFASLLIESGANPKSIQLQMGHATITKTFDTYAHRLPGGEEDLLAKADAFMAREGERPALRAVR
jgi:integrase